CFATRSEVHVSYRIDHLGANTCSRSANRAEPGGYESGGARCHHEPDPAACMAFIGANDIFVLEKATGKVQRVVDGTITSTLLDLPVNSASERGLLGIALHPD